MQELCDLSNDRHFCNAYFSNKCHSCFQVGPIVNNINPGHMIGDDKRCVDGLIRVKLVDDCITLAKGKFPKSQSIDIYQPARKFEVFMKHSQYSITSHKGEVEGHIIRCRGGTRCSCTGCYSIDSAQLAYCD